MSAALLVDIVYVGSKSYKEDNICKSGAVWFGYGDVQKIERKFVPPLLKHPDVWMLKAEFDVRFKSASTLASAIPTADSGFTGENEPGIALQQFQILQEAHNLENAVSAIYVPSEEKPEGEPKIESVIPPTEVPVATIEDIKGAIVLMQGEKGNEEYWTDTGRPKVAGVRGLIGKDVSVKDLSAAWASMGGE